MYKKILKVKFFKEFNNLEKYIENIAWSTVGKFFNVILSGISGILAARFLGPTNYGLLSLSLSIFLLSSFSLNIANEQIVIKNFVQNKDKSDVFFINALFLKTISLSLSIIFLISYLIFFNKETSNLLILLVIFSVIFFKPFEVINYYFQSVTKIKYIFFSETISYFSILLIRILIIITNKNEKLFIYTYFFEIFFITLLLLINFIRLKKDKNNIDFFSLDKINLKIIKDISKQSLPFFLSAILITIYMRIDQIFIVKFINLTENGVYSIAVKLAELWTFIPMAIIAAIFPSIVDTKKNIEKFNKRFSQLTYLILFLSVTISIFMVIFGKTIIKYLYGNDYILSYNILIFYIWTLIPISLGMVISKWLTINELQKYQVFSTFAGAIINIAFNIILIPKIGVIGAALSSLVSYFIAGVFSFLFFKDTRKFIAIFSIKNLEILKK
ncbi:MAG: flippase [Candidatus Pacebacteria bacterium]|nr:flippase [Candidatus Paceibacterota bacterium]